jgi:histidyl-tRNA synthetase
MVDLVFSRLGVRVAIKLNNRKVLAGIAELIGAPDKIIDITVAIDKIDKIGIDAVNDELRERGLSENSINTLQPILSIDGTIDERLSRLSDLLATSEIGKLGVEELTFVIEKTKSLGLNAELDLDVSLARGLNYYTGTIIEVKALDVQIGSITGGGRYDNLTGVFGMPGVSGVGISFGADRIYDVLNTLNLYPEAIEQSSTIMFTNLGDAEAAASLGLIKSLRAAGVAAELYPENAKMKKQMAYADALKTPFVAFIGESELNDNTVTVKNMQTGEQTTLPVGELSAYLTK